MISINDVDCEYLWTVNGLEFTEDVKERWNSMDFQERCKYLTTKPDRIEFSAREVLDDLFVQSEQSYDVEDMYDGLLNDTTDEFVNRFQEILDEISGFDSAEFFTAADEIDPTIDLEEVTE